MIPQPPADKETLARELARWIVITGKGQTKVTVADIASWDAEQVYTWLEAWGFEFINGQWARGAK